MLPRNIFDCLPQRGSPDRTARDTKNPSTYSRIRLAISKTREKERENR